MAWTVAGGCGYETDPRPWRILHVMALEESVALRLIESERSLALSTDSDTVEEEDRARAWVQCRHRSEYSLMLARHVDAICAALSDTEIPEVSRCEIGPYPSIELPACSGAPELGSSDLNAKPSGR